MHRDLSSYACHTSKHLCTERTTSDSLMFCHQRLSIANKSWNENYERNFINFEPLFRFYPNAIPTHIGHNYTRSYNFSSIAENWHKLAYLRRFSFLKKKLYNIKDRTNSNYSSRWKSSISFCSSPIFSPITQCVFGLQVIHFFKSLAHIHRYTHKYRTFFLNHFSARFTLL